MMELVTLLIAPPLLYGIGLFYWRLGGWFQHVARRSGRAGMPAVGRAEPPQDSRYEAALAAARAILQSLATRPDMQGHERLASVTYAVLEAMHRLD